MEAKSNGSENRMPSIVEAGALAVATTVKDHSLTSKNNIESFHYDKKPRGVPKMPSPVNTNIQHNLNRTLVLMILFATSGFVIWNGEKRRALYKISAEEKRLSYLLHNDYSRGLALYIKEVGAKFYNESREKHEKFQLDYSLENFTSILDTLSKWRKSVKSYVRPFLFFDSLRLIELAWRDYVFQEVVPYVGDDNSLMIESYFKLDDLKCDQSNEQSVFGSAVAKNIHKYMQEFFDQCPKSSSNNYVQLKEKYFDIFGFAEKDYPRSVLTFWEKKIGVMEEKKE